MVSKSNQLIMKKNYPFYSLLRCAFICSCIFLTGTIAFSQSVPDLLWSKNYNAPYGDVVRHTIATHDGGFIMMGDSDSYGPGLLSTLLVKCDAQGTMQWSRTYGGASFDLPMGIEQTDDDGFIVATYSNSYPPEGMNIRLIKTDAFGDTLWTSVIPNSNGISFQVTGCIKQTADGGYMVAGSAWRIPNCNQILLFKVSSTGQYVWHREFGGFSDDWGASIQATNDGNYILGGYTYSYGNGECDGYMIKVNPEGEEIWNSVVGGGSFDSYHFIRTVSDGYIGVGSTQSYGGAEQGFIAKINEDGTLAWTSALGGNNNEGFEGVIETINHQYIVTGSTNSYGNGMHDFLIMKVDHSGTMLAMETYGGYDEDFGSTIDEAPGTGYIAGATFTGDYLDYHALLFAADSINTAVQYFGGILESPVTLKSIDPNPFANITSLNFSMKETGNIAITILNTNGIIVDEVFNGTMGAGEHSVTYENQELPAGIYLCQLKTDNYTITKKIVKTN